MAQIKYELRHYQREWIEDIYNSWNRGNMRVLAQMACGAGKTVCFAYIANNFLNREKRVLAIAHRVELIDQAANKFREITGLDVGIIKGKTKLNLEAPIQVASIQTLSQRKELPANVGFVIIDESHHASASTYREIIEYYDRAKILGVTATPQRLDGQGFDDLFDDLVIGYPTERLIKEGFLSKFRLFATEQTINTYAIVRSHGDFNSNDLALAVMNQITIEDIYHNYCKFAKEQSTIIYAASIAHSKEIAQYFQQNGITAEHLDGDTAPKERLKILERFQSGSVKVLTNYEILLEGYDYHDVNCVFCVRPTESSTLWLQMVGRALRISKYMSVATIIDVTDNWKKHGLPDDARRWTLNASPMPTKFRGLVKCEKCTHIFRPLSHELEAIYADIDDNGLLIKHHQALCPNCGAECQFTTTEDETSHQRVRVRLKSGLSLEISEINLEINSGIIQQVYGLIKSFDATPEDTYKAIYKKFIEIIHQFTLGDWRRIVKLVEPVELIPTKKAWILYQEGLLKYRNRLAAIASIEKRKQQEKFKVESINKQLDTVVQVIKKPATVGNPEVKKQYHTEWMLALSRCIESTKNFLSNHGGLFYVEFIGYNVNISIEIENIPDLKSRLRLIGEEELQEAFTATFGRKANVMFRLAK